MKLKAHRLSEVLLITEKHWWKESRLQTSWAASVCLHIPHKPSPSLYKCVPLPQSHGTHPGWGCATECSWASAGAALRWGPSTCTCLEGVEGTWWGGECDSSGLMLSHLKITRRRKDESGRKTPGVLGIVGETETLLLSDREVRSWAVLLPPLPPRLCHHPTSVPSTADTSRQAAARAAGTRSVRVGGCDDSPLVWQLLR